MAPLPPTTTKRWFLDYSVGGVDHTLMMRSSANVTAAEAVTAISGFLAQLAPVLYEITVTGFRVAELNSNVTNPVVWTGNATYGSGAAPENSIPNFISFIGRSAGGRRARVFVFGFKLNYPSNYRFEAGENADVDDARAQLDAYANRWLTIDTLDAVWNAYANTGVNAYWQRQIRVT
jgi:hypothetical protein